MRWLVSLLFLVAFAVSVQAYSTGPPAGTVMANDGCVSGGGCHGTAPNDGTKVTVSGFPATYALGARYNVNVSSTTDVVQSPAGNKGGFLVWASKGTFETRPGSEDWYQIDKGPSALTNGTHWIAHNSNGDSANSAQKWWFLWRAPTTNQGAAVVKAYVNRVNGDGMPSELDHWNRHTIQVAAPAGGTTAPTTPPTTTSPRTSPTATSDRIVITSSDSPGLALPIVLAALGAAAALRIRPK